MFHTYNLKAKNQGFTIVELLIVIVVIGILAAITIISYAGITAKANTTKAQTNAVNTKKVAEAFNTEAGYYPGTTANLTAGYGSNPSSKLPTSISLYFTGGAGLNATPSSTNGLTTVWYQYKGTLGSTTGGRIQYWDFTGTPALSTNVIYVGDGKSGDTFVTPAS
jgi:prepilin-type N-terminal cleavage/methylation domain-containing protein